MPDVHKVSGENNSVTSAVVPPNKEGTLVKHTNLKDVGSPAIDNLGNVWAPFELHKNSHVPWDLKEATTPFGPPGHMKEG